MRVCVTHRILLDTSDKAFVLCREKKMSRCSALKVLDFSMTGPDGMENCNKFIEILGLRSVFPLWMKVNQYLIKSQGESRNKTHINIHFS